MSTLNYNKVPNLFAQQHIISTREKFALLLKPGARERERMGEKSVNLRHISVPETPEHRDNQMCMHLEI